LIDAVERLDSDLARLTGRRIDLKLIFPAGLFALAIRQIATNGLGISQVPGYVLLWYAFDSFWKFHREPPHPNRPKRGRARAEVSVTHVTETDGSETETAALTEAPSA